MPAKATLETLAKMLADAKGPKVFLGRQNAGGGLAQDSEGRRQLVFAASGLTLRNGTLQLRSGAEPVLRSNRSWPEGLYVRKSSGSSNGPGVVLVDDANCTAGVNGRLQHSWQLDQSPAYYSGHQESIFRRDQMPCCSTCSMAQHDTGVGREKHSTFCLPQLYPIYTIPVPCVHGRIQVCTT